MENKAIFTYYEDYKGNGECYVLETYNEVGESEGVTAVYKIRNNLISYTALIKAIELANTSIIELNTVSRRSE